MDLPIEHRVLLLHTFGSSAGRTLISLYEGINTKLLADGILPQLRVFSAARVHHRSPCARRRAGWHQAQWHEPAAMPGQIWSGYRMIAIGGADATHLEHWPQQS